MTEYSHSGDVSFFIGEGLRSVLSELIHNSLVAVSLLCEAPGLWTESCLEYFLRSALGYKFLHCLWYLIRLRIH